MRLLQHVGVIDPHDFEMGVKDVQGWSTFGRPDGTYASSPDNFTHSHTGSFHQTRRGGTDFAAPEATAQHRIAFTLAELL